MFESGLRHQRGFTLIEMSIVLVIIGLIIGGILKGQELIESARQKNMISQIDLTRAAVTTFTDRYRAFPGDYSQATTNIAGCTAALCYNGDDNGRLNANTTDTAALMALDGTSAPSSTGERWSFFSHLVASDLLGTATLTAISSNATNFAGGANPSPLPAAAWPQSGMDIVYGTHSGASTNGNSTTGHWLRVKRMATAVTTGNYALSANRLAQIDMKYDDGLAMDGRIRSSNLTTTCNANGANGYAATNTELGCHIIIALD